MNMFPFTAGDVIFDNAATVQQAGVVTRLEQGAIGLKVYAHWQDEDVDGGWTPDELWTHAPDLIHHPEPDPVWASYCVWRLTQ